MRGNKLKFSAMTAAIGAALVLALGLALADTITVAFSEDVGTPAQTQSPAAQSPPAPTVPPAETILNSHEVEGILGREVVSTAGENMGHIVDVIVDRSGQVRAAIIDYGGFLGVGSRKIAVDWNALHFPPPAQSSDAKIALELSRDQVKAAPEYQEGKPIVVLGALGKLEPLPE